MKKLFLLLIACGLLVIAKKVAFAQPCKEVVGYLPNWQWYDRSQLVNPKTIDYSKYTVLNYSFFKPQSDGTIAATDSWADENLLYGEHDWNLGGYKPNTSVIDRAHNAGVKVMVSIGGWTLSNNFPAIAADPAKRQKFGEECVRLIKEFNFDGIDIDWEYPGTSDPERQLVANPNDKTNFTLFLQQIRSAIDAYGTTKGKKYLLSACFSADPNKAAMIEWNNMVTTLDMINVMTYDFFGAWEPISNHNSPLYAPAQGAPAFNIDAAFKMLTQTYNVPSSKINLGVAFYGRSFKNCKGIFQSHSGSDTEFYPDDLGTPMYYNIMAKFSGFTRYWDDQAKVPYAINSTSGTLISYDDEESIGLKAEYVAQNQARGVIIWEITGDYIQTANGIKTPLADKLSQVFCTVTGVSEKAEADKEITLFPNPTTGSIKINIPSESKIQISDITGKLLYSKEVQAGINTLDVSNLHPGSYIFTITGADKNLTYKKVVIY